jgi:putative membrane protein
MMHWDDGAGWSWWWMLPMTLFTLAIIGAAIWGAVTVARSTMSRPHTEYRPTAEDILDERFARGEIEASEYHDRMDALRGARSMTKT